MIKSPIVIPLGDPRSSLASDEKTSDSIFLPGHPVSCDREGAKMIKSPIVIPLADGETG